VFMRDGYDVDIADSAESAFEVLEHRSYISRHERVLFLPLAFAA
jgi:hypothetical protein